MDILLIKNDLINYPRQDLYKLANYFNIDTNIPYSDLVWMVAICISHRYLKLGEMPNTLKGESCKKIIKTADVSKVSNIPYIYVIIDMQESYPFYKCDLGEEFIEEILDDIRKAMADGALIIVAELTPKDILMGGKTIGEITNLLKEYNQDLVITVESTTQDKTIDIFCALQGKPHPGQ